MENYYLYVILTRTNTMISKLIQLTKGDEYTHAAISLDRELKNMYSFGRKYTYNPFQGRFKKEGIDEGVYKFHKTLPGIVMEVQVSKQQYEKANDLLSSFISNSNNYKYNYKGLLYSLLNKSVCYGDRFLCSEFVYYILKESGVIDFNISRSLVRPQNFLNLDSKIVYEGNLKDMFCTNYNYDLKDKELRKLSVI